MAKPKQPRADQPKQSAERRSGPEKPAPVISKRNNYDPKFVGERLKTYKAQLLQDVETLRTAWPGLVHNKWPNHETVSAGDYLRSRMLTFQTSGKSEPTDSTTAAWHPLILGACPCN